MKITKRKRNKTAKNTKNLRVPGQWEPQECIYLAYPTNGNGVRPSIMKKYTNLPEMTDIQSEIIKLGSKYIKIVMIFSTTYELNSFINKYSQKLKGCTFYYYIIPHCDVWIRDTGMEFLCNKNRQVLVNHNFKLWGYTHNKINGPWKHCDVPNKIPPIVAKKQHINVKTFTNKKMNAEGGNRSFNGAGVCVANITTELQRNAPLSIDAIEQQIKKLYNLKKMLWLVDMDPDDIKTDMGAIAMEKARKVYTAIGTGGHTDEICRFVNRNTVVLAGLGGDFEKKYGYVPGQYTFRSELAMSRNYNILKRYKIGTKPLNIVRLPISDVPTIEITKEDGSYSLIKQVTKYPLDKKIRILPASSYVNFLITNKCVFIPGWSIGCKDPRVKKRLEKTDKMAYNTFKKLFPKRKIFQVNNLAYNVAGGGFNCTYCDQPKLGFKPKQALLNKIEL